MDPKEIITREIMKIPNIRIPIAAMIVERIFKSLDEHGYAITDKTVKL